MLTSMETPRALLAARKSTKVAGAEGQSLHTQDEHSRRFCERLGFEIVGAAKDTISGRVAPIDRRELGAWIKAPHRFDVIVAYRTDRLSRGDQEDWTRIEHWATEHRKTLVIVDSAEGIRYPARGDADYWQWQATKREAGREWEASRERNLRAQADLVARGAVTGRAPYGYRIVGDRYGKTFEIVPHEAEIVRELFARTIEGESLRDVCEWFNGVSGRAWTPDTIGDALDRWTYAGRLERNGQTYGSCPAIVTPAVLADAQAAKRSRRLGTKGGRRPGLEPPLMVLTCAEDGLRMYRMGGHPFGYYCSGRHGFGLVAELADRAVIAKLTSSTAKLPEPVLVKGYDRRGEIAALQRSQRQALDRRDIPEVVRLDAVIAEIEAEKVVADRIVYEVTEDTPTIGEKFSAMSREEIRAELRRGWKILAYPDGRIDPEPPWRDEETGKREGELTPVDRETLLRHARELGRA